MHIVDYKNDVRNNGTPNLLDGPDMCWIHLKSPFCMSWGSGAALVRNERRTSSFGTCAWGKFSHVTLACRLLEVVGQSLFKINGCEVRALVSPLKYHNNLGVSTANNSLTEWTLNNHLGRWSDHHRSWRNHLENWSNRLQSRKLERSSRELEWLGPQPEAALQKRFPHIFSRFSGDLKVKTID